MWFFLLTVSFPFMAGWADEPNAPAEPTAAEAPKPSVSLSTDLPQPVHILALPKAKAAPFSNPPLRPPMTVFSANVWGNFDTARHSDNPLLSMPAGQVGNGRWSETDITVSYTKELCKNFSVLIGNVFYSLQPPLSNFNQDELFGGISYAFPWLTVA